VIRRLIVGYPSNALNKIFMTLYDKVDTLNYLYSVQKALLLFQGKLAFPTDSMVIEELKNKDVYGMKGKSKNYIFERLENFENKERVDIDGNSDITIEHIFPQSPNKQWIEELGKEECEEIKEKYLHTIGNLSLTGYNSKLSNDKFSNKRDMKGGYKESKLYLNKDLAKIERWDKEAIKIRSKKLAKRFVGIWKYPNIVIEKIEENEAVNIFEADDPTNKKIDYIVFFDVSYQPDSFRSLYLLVLNKVIELYPEFVTSDLAKKWDITTEKKEYTKNQSYNTPINDMYFARAGISAGVTFKRIKQVLGMYNLDDELYIKYGSSDDEEL
jgi:hypothetical protein